MSMLAEALDDFDAPIGNSIFEHGASGSGSSASSLLPFHAFTASSQALHHDVADPVTLRLLTDALDAFDEPGGGGGTCVRGAPRACVRFSSSLRRHERVKPRLQATLRTTHYRASTAWLESDWPAGGSIFWETPRSAACTLRSSSS